MSAVDAANFSLDAYAQLLADMAGRGYQVVGFDAVNPGSRHLVLRHDVDVSLDLAVELARVEHSLGYGSHYFVLVTSEQYNPASQVGRRALGQIISLGHRIGLHFDAALDCAQSLNARAAAEARYLSALAGVEVSMLSFHRPAQAYINNAADFADLPHTYQPRYFSEIGYCSDSHGGWWRGGPLEHEAVRSGRALQLLTHPFWWVYANRCPEERLADHVGRRQADLMHDLQASIVVPQEGDG